MNSIISFFKSKEKTCRRKGNLQWLRFLIFRERVCHFSLRSRAIGPLDFVEPRRKVVLRSEDYAWTPVLRSFNKLREVGILSYLSYTLFKCFVNVTVGLRP